MSDPHLHNTSSPHRLRTRKDESRPKLEPTRLIRTQDDDDLTLEREDEHVNDVAVDGTIAIYPHANPLPNNLSRRSKIARKSVEARPFSSSIEKPPSESNLSLKRNLSEYDPHTVSVPDSPTGTRGSPRSSCSNTRKRTLSDSDAILDRSPNQGNLRLTSHDQASQARIREPTKYFMLGQPDTPPITQDQLVNEVKEIYAGLIMVEKKCVEIDQQQAATTNKLSNEQWQAFIALHRTLLHEHHDFFLASQHPSASPGLRRLATRYAMPSRMWRHGIHSFLELLRHRLPDSLDHMLAFVYFAYSMMGLLEESVTGFKEIWIEGLGDLARYRMAIEEADLRDREVWMGVARMWYNKASDKSPNVGRIQHHLAVVSRPNIVQQLFYYSKALISVVPFHNARESVMLLWNPFLEGADIASQRYPTVEATFVKCNGIHFTRGLISEYQTLAGEFTSILDNHIGRVTAKWRVQGPEIASTLCAVMQDFGNSDAYLTQILRKEEEKRDQVRDEAKEQSTEDNSMELSPTASFPSPKSQWVSLDDNDFPRLQPSLNHVAITQGAKFVGSEDTTSHAYSLTLSTFSINLQRIGDKNVLPFIHIMLAFVWSLTFVPAALIYIEDHIPWEKIVRFLNTLGRSGVVVSNFECDPFPPSLSGTGRQLPEDFVMRGLLWAQYYFPPEFFADALENEDERTIELPSHGICRAERCLWLGRQLAMIGRWLSYDQRTKQFSITEFAKSLPGYVSSAASDDRSPTLSATTDHDVQMVDG